MTEDDYKNAFEDILIERGYSQLNDTDDNIYNLIWNNDPGRIITARLIASIPGNESTFGIRGIQAIGNFRFKTPPPGVSEPDFHIFAFMNPCNSRIEFIVIPSPEIKKRLRHRNRIISDDQETEFVFWLMEDNCIYDTTSLGAEGRWWYIDGRMADNSFLSYTSFLNCWEF